METKIEKHTPGPFELIGTVIWSPSSKQVLCACGEPETRSLGVTFEPISIDSANLHLAYHNAAFVHRACNSHNALVDALSKVADICRHNCAHEAAPAIALAEHAIELASKP